MAVVSPPRRARRGARRTAPRTAGVALLLLGFGLGGWPPVAAVPGLAAPALVAPVGSISVVSGPADLVTSIAATPVEAHPVLALDLTAGAVVVLASSRDVVELAQRGIAGVYDSFAAPADRALPVAVQPLDAHPAALRALAGVSAPASPDLRARAGGSAAGSRAPPHAA